MEFDYQFEKACVFINKLKKAFGSLIGYETQEDWSYKANATNCLEEVKKGLGKEIESLNVCIGDMSNIVDSKQPNDENYFLLHFYSKIHSLEAVLLVVEDLIEVIKNSKHEQLTIRKKVHSFLRDEDLQKDYEGKIFKDELDELTTICLDYTYELEVVPDIPEETLTKAKVEVAAALTMLGVGLVFPPAEVVIAPLAADLISNAVFDLIIDLFSEEQQPPDLKQILIDEGLMVFTLGLSKLMKCTKVINKARRICQKCSKALRKCPIFKRLAEKFALKFKSWAQKLKKYKPKMKLPHGSFKKQIYKKIKEKAIHEITEFISVQALKEAKAFIQEELQKVVNDLLSPIFKPIGQNIIEIKNNMEVNVKENVMEFLKKMVYEPQFGIKGEKGEEESKNEEEKEQNLEELIIFIEDFFKNSQRRINVIMAIFSRFFKQIIKVYHLSQEFFQIGIKSYVKDSVKRVQTSLKLIKKLNDE